MAFLLNSPFLQISYKQHLFYSEVYELTVKKHIHIPGNYILVHKLPLKNFNQPQTTTLSTGIPCSQLLQNDYHQLNFTETYEPNPKTQYRNLFLENKTKDSLVVHTQRHFMIHRFPRKMQCHITTTSTIYSLQSTSSNSKSATEFLSGHL